MSNQYKSPLSSRYASTEMKYIFSEDKKFTTWRKLWIALAKTQQELGLDISDEQIQEMETFKDDINYDVAIAYEKKFHHDVMAHVHAYGEQCPKSKGIIHLGATSCYVGDNTDIILMKEGLELILRKCTAIIHKLSEFSYENRKVATLAFTHYQAAQPTTIGKRASLWIHDLMMDFNRIEDTLDNLQLLGCKGTTGTQASFMALFDNDYEKVSQLDAKIADKMDFAKAYPVSGQTYSRKVDSDVVFALAQIATSAHKFSNDIRLLQHDKEIEEPFAKNQIGSSAMAYKRNPMRCERIASLSRYVMVDVLNPIWTASAQWLERTLDDSANKRISIPEAFLAVDSICDLWLNVVDGLVINHKIIEKHLEEELPFMATENIMMEAVKRGKDRQEVHERIRELSMLAGQNVKMHGLKNNLLELIAGDESFDLSLEELQDLMHPNLYIGCADLQVETYLNEEINPFLEKHQDLLGVVSEVLL